MTNIVTDAEIEAAIEEQDDPDHPDALTVPEVRELLDHVQHAAEQGWGVYMDNLEDGAMELIHEDSNLLVFATGDRPLYTEELEQTYDGDVTVDSVAKQVVSAAIHKAANRLTDYNWGVQYPLVVAMPEGVEGGQRYVEAAINNLLKRGLSPGQAWAFYGVEIRGHSRNQWASRCGYNDHSAVSEPLRKAHEKLPT